MWPGDTPQTRSDSAAIRFGADGSNLYPILGDRRIAPQQLRVIVDCVHDYVNIAIIVEIAECAAPRSRGPGNAGAALQGDIFEASVPQVLVKKLPLRITGLGL